MPCKKKKQPLPKPKCTLSSWRLLDTVPIQDLRQSAVVCVASSKQVIGQSSSQSDSCSCDEDVCTPGTCCVPGTCCGLDPQGKESYTPRLEQELKGCVPNCQVNEVEAMIDEIRNCREIIRTLALEAMDILHPENLQQYKQSVPTQQGPITNGKENCRDSGAHPIEPALQAKPTDLRQKTDCLQKKCEISEPRKCSGSEGQSTTPLFAIPPTLKKSPLLSNKSSSPVDQNACQINNKGFCQKAIRKKPGDCTCDGEKKQNVDCRCDETMNKTTLGSKPSECGCDGNTMKKVDCKCDDKPETKTDCKTLLLKTFGKKPSEYSRDGEEKKKVDCRCDETIIEKTLGSKPSECGCDGKKIKEADCKCDEKPETKTDCKTLLMKTFGKKPSEYSRDGEEQKKVDCRCDETINKKTLGSKPSECGCDGNKMKEADCKCDEKPETKSDCKTLLLKTFGKKPSECVSICDGKQTKESCMCDETKKRENKTDPKSFLQKTFGWISCDTAPVVIDDCVCDDEMQKKNKAACTMPNCATKTCMCHFPPTYSQYFNCTGHVSGNCHCDKHA